jgi:alpha-N-arabinofuranosidase
MTAEYYANEYKRYASYSKNYPDARLRKIAGGANSFDYHWTETLMRSLGDLAADPAAHAGPF